jgi:hypothetical protein
VEFDIDPIETADLYYEPVNDRIEMQLLSI